jgi:hypothetical protein
MVQAMELQTGWWDGFGERWQRGSMWLANQACFSFIPVAKAHVEGCSATFGIEVRFSDHFDLWVFGCKLRLDATLRGSHKEWAQTLPALKCI